VAPGVVALARWSGRPIVPVAVVYRHAWRLGSWDRFEVPWPGTRMVLGYGEPMTVGGPDGDAARAEVASRLQALTARLEQAVTGRALGEGQGAAFEGFRS
jgi:lysophospholipid acyltransferase (LPLAT)-like uncharacterized protein